MSSASSGSSGGSASILPTYRAFTGVTADLPGDGAGVPDGFFTYPHPAKASTDGKPGSGGAITAMIPISVQAPTPVSDNKWWQALNAHLGVTLDIKMTPSASWAAKLSTIVAGGDLPDLIQVSGVPRLPDVLKAKFQDLTEYLSGDAILEYPNLANLRTVGWNTCVYGGGIYAMPPQNIVGTPTWIRRDDVLEKMKITFDPKDSDDVRAVCKEMTQAKDNVYAFANAVQVVEQLGCTMFGAPNQWSVSGGKFTSMYETDQYKQAVQYAADLWKDGSINPDAYTGINAPQLYQASKAILFCWGGTGMGGVLAQDIPGMKMGFWAAPSADGKGVGAKWLGTGANGLCAMSKQKSEDKIKEILRIWNWMCSPFGTAEYLQLTYGDEGVDYTWDGTQQIPVPTDRLKSDNPGGEFVYIGGPPFVVFWPGYKYAAQSMYDVQKATIPVGVHSAAEGLYSDTNSSDGPTLTKMVTDARDAVVQGRSKISDFESAVAKWKAAGGDKIRAEYETAYAAAHGG